MGTNPQGSGEHENPRFCSQARAAAAILDIMPELSAAELRAVEDAVRSVVAHDEDRLRVIAADAGDLYVWVRNYGTHGVDLVLPPGTAADWPLDVIDVHDGTKSVIVEMWTREEGRSDLSLELELREPAPGVWQPRVLNLHVL